MDGKRERVAVTIQVKATGGSMLVLVACSGPAPSTLSPRLPVRGHAEAEGILEQ
jgi:hypothetical protein